MKVTPQGRIACEKCNRPLVIVKSQPVGASSRVQYLGCRHCRIRPAENKLVISIPETHRIQNAVG